MIKETKEKLGILLQITIHLKPGKLPLNKGAYAQVSYFFNEINPAIPEELELAFRYAFIDEPDSTNSLVGTNAGRKYTWAVNYFIAGHGNKIT